MLSNTISKNVSTCNFPNCHQFNLYNGQQFDFPDCHHFLIAKMTAVIIFQKISNYIFPECQQLLLSNLLANIFTKILAAIFPNCFQLFVYRLLADVISKRLTITNFQIVHHCNFKHVSEQTFPKCQFPKLLANTNSKVVSEYNFQKYEQLPHAKGGNREIGGVHF